MADPYHKCCFESAPSVKYKDTDSDYRKYEPDEEPASSED